MHGAVNATDKHIEADRRPHQRGQASEAGVFTVKPSDRTSGANQAGWAFALVTPPPLTFWSHYPWMCEIPRFTGLVDSAPSVDFEHLGEDYKAWAAELSGRNGGHGSSGKLRIPTAPSRPMAGPSWPTYLCCSLPRDLRTFTFGQRMVFFRIKPLAGSSPAIGFSHFCSLQKHEQLVKLSAAHEWVFRIKPTRS